jgi:hypothetical protein
LHQQLARPYGGNGHLFEAHVSIVVIHRNSHDFTFEGETAQRSMT